MDAGFVSVLLIGWPGRDNRRPESRRAPKQSPVYRKPGLIDLLSATDSPDMASALGVLVADGGVLIVTISEQLLIHRRAGGHFDQPTEPGHPIAISRCPSAAGAQQNKGYNRYNPGRPSVLAAAGHGAGSIG